MANEFKVKNGLIVDAGGIQATGSIVGQNGITGSIAATNNVISGSSQIALLGYAITGSNSFTGSQTITGSLLITGSILQNGGALAVQDGTILYHSIAWFTPSSTVSTSGTTVTSVGTQFTSAMVGAKLTISGESRIITAYTSPTQVTVASAYSQNYSGVASGSWSVYRKCVQINSDGTLSFTFANGNWSISDYGAITLSDVIRIPKIIGGWDGTNERVLFGVQTGVSGLALGSPYVIQWANNSSVTAGTKDLGLRRNNTGSLEIYDGVTADGAIANRRDLIARDITGSNATFSGSFNITGSLTASLQQGYAWVGGAGNISRLVATSSFGGTSGFLTTDYDFNTTDSPIIPTGSITFIQDSGSTYQVIPNASGVNFKYLNTTLIGFVNSQSVYFTTPFTASLQQGYAWVGGVGNVSTLVSTSSFGSPINISSLNSFTSSQYVSNSFFATTGSNLFRANQTFSGSLIPAVSGAYDLGTLTNPWRHIYVGSGSIYLVDGKQSITRTISADTLLTTTDIASGTVSLTASLPTGVVSGSSQILGGSGLVSGAAQVTPLLPTGVISGSIQVLGGSGIISSSAQLNNTTITNLSVTNLTVVNETASVLFSSGSNRFGDFGDDVHDFTGSVKISGSITTIGASTATSFNGIINATNGVVSGSSQVIGILSSLNTYTGSQDTKNSTLASYTGSNDTKWTTLTNITSSLISATGSYETKGRGIVSGSSQVDVMSTTNIARLATTGSNTFTGTQTLTGTTNLTDSTATGNGDKTVSIIANKSGVGYHNLSIGGYQHTFLVGGSQTLALTMGTTGNVTPGANGTQDLGSSALRWSTVYTSDLSLNNGIGDWTIVEGEDDLFLYNNKKGKVYKFALTEVDPNVATPKKS
jgi:hypothetical protein